MSKNCYTSGSVNPYHIAFCGKMIRKGSFWWNTLQLWTEFCLQQDSSQGPDDPFMGALITQPHRHFRVQLMKINSYKYTYDTLHLEHQFSTINPAGLLAKSYNNIILCQTYNTFILFIKPIKKKTVFSWKNLYFSLFVTSRNSTLTFLQNALLFLLLVPKKWWKLSWNCNFFSSFASLAQTL